MLNRAITAFNVFSGTPPAKALRMGSVKRRPQLGVSEVRSVCAFAASLRRVKTLDEEILVCEAWLCVVGTQLDASAEREMLWRCTVMSFGASANFEACQATFRQNLFNDTLMAQRVARKDLSTRFYIQIVDTLRRKFCFDFYNPMVVQKCIATTQALINDRDVAVIGEAGAGKTDCIANLLLNQKTLSVNTLAHDAGEALRLVSISAAEAIRSTLHSTNGADASPSSTSSIQPGQKDIWLTLDGPVNPELFEAMSATLPVVILGGQKPFLIPKRNFRIIVESDRLEMVSPATASSLAITFIDTERGPTWKDRALAWAHRFVLTCPEYSHFMELTKELLMHLMVESDLGIRTLGNPFEETRHEAPRRRLGKQGRVGRCKHGCVFQLVPKTRHCRRCEKCVAGFDHHCLWLNTAWRPSRRMRSHGQRAASADQVQEIDQTLTRGFRYNQFFRIFVCWELAEIRRAGGIFGMRGKLDGLPPYPFQHYPFPGGRGLFATFLGGAHSAVPVGEEVSVSWKLTNSSTWEHIRFEFPAQLPAALGDMKVSPASGFVAPKSQETITLTFKCKVVNVTFPAEVEGGGRTEFSTLSIQSRKKHEAYPMHDTAREEEPPAEPKYEEAVLHSQSVNEAFESY
ncbi:hypothetical protein AK812_SmicGene23474 [Symbiodinium microadriaticum]|uniref:Palmitoyltransferase n=1 Tax=Symbiodinium microadriaticum TaxID=2951 RepID=A0A1Q9DH50_SYMMI|nr:hypothetical protein AK812_SmicGene23474 [Symbiodinium microadriaticum]